MSDAIAADGVTKVFPPRLFPRHAAHRRVLADVSLSMAFGEIVALMGPNGAGKTTLLEIVATVLEPTRGTVHVCGRDARRHPAAARAVLSYAGVSGHGFYARMPAGWNLEFFAVLNDMPRAEARRRAKAWLDKVGLGEAVATRVETFSEGMRQRLGLARAMMTDPSILLLDEPTRSVDPTFRRTVHQLLRDWCAGHPRRAALMVTHSFDEAESVCDRVCVLDAGRVVWTGPAREARLRGGFSDPAPREACVRAFRP